MGVIDRVLISRQTHVISQCVVEVIIEVLRAMLVVIISQDSGVISRGRFWHFRGMGPIACLADPT